MDALLDHVRTMNRTHGLIAPGDGGAVAFSGGPDSLCLLHLLGQLRRDMGFEVVALHVDHGLRPGSAGEAEQAAALARGLGLEVEVLRAELSLDGEGNLQQRAREARLGLLAGAAGDRGCRWVALGHTATDQAETVLMRAVRGAGLQGLAGMAAARAPFIRPLLQVERPDVRAYLQRHSLTPLEDPSNRSDLYLRNRLRRHVMPLLEQENPAVVQALCRLARSCREDDEALEAGARQLLERARDPDGVKVSELRGLLPGLLHRVLRLAYAGATGSTRRLSRMHVEQMARLLSSEQGTASLDLPGARLRREYGLLRWESEGKGEGEGKGKGEGKGEGTWGEPVEVAGPGVYSLPDGRSLEVRLAGPGQVAAGQTLDPVRVPFPLWARGPAPGDRVAVGHKMSRKVARLLMDAKIPRADRWRVPLVFCGDVVVAVVGVRVAHGYVGEPGGRGLVLKLS